MESTPWKKWTHAAVIPANKHNGRRIYRPFFIYYHIISRLAPAVFNNNSDMQKKKKRQTSIDLFTCSIRVGTTTLGRLKMTN